MVWDTLKASSPTVITRDCHGDLAIGGAGGQKLGEDTPFRSEA